MLKTTAKNGMIPPKSTCSPKITPTAPRITNFELNRTNQVANQRIARYLERLTLLERDAENSYLPAVSSITESGTEYLYMADSC
jgi:hypothetical protein